jgi:hypothetical protein
MDLAGTVPYEQVNGLQNANVNYGGNYIVDGSSRGALSPDVAEKIFNKLNEIANAPSSVISKPKMVMLWEYHDLRKLASIAPDATAYRMRTTNLISPMFGIWEGDSPEAEAEVRKRVKQMRAFSEELLLEGREKHKDETGYGNYGEQVHPNSMSLSAHNISEFGEPNTSVSSEVLFGGNYPRLQQIKKKYDPNVVFGTWYPIAPSN